MFRVLFLFLISTKVFAAGGESPFITQFREQCRFDSDMQCEDVAPNIIKGTFTYDRDKRVFYITPKDFMKVNQFMYSQDKAFAATSSSGDEAVEYIGDLEYKRNVIEYLQIACMSGSGACLFLTSKVKRVGWAAFIYGACTAAGSVCKIQGDTSMKQLDEEIKQVKEACKEGSKTEACLKRVAKGKKSDKLPADGPVPGEPGGSSDGASYPGTGGGDGGQASLPPGEICVAHTVVMVGGPKGQMVEEQDVTCYAI